MELLQLQYFVTVARMEHVTEAAKSLHVTQSSLSKTIQRLEEDLGAPLFDRTGRNLRLNELGSRFLSRAEKALFELEQGKQEIRDLIIQEQDSLELAVTAASALPNILKQFRKKRPHIQFHVQMLATRDMIERLHRGEVDLCLSSPPVQDEELECQIVFTDPILVAVPEGHRLSKRTGVTLNELKDEWFVGVKKGYGTRDLVDSVCREAGFDPHYVYEGDEPARLSAIVEAEVGIAFIPSTARDAREHIHYLAIEDYDLARDIALIWHKRRYISQAAVEFRELVKEYFETLREGEDKGQENNKK